MSVVLTTYSLVSGRYRLGGKSLKGGLGVVL